MNDHYLMLSLTEICEAVELSQQTLFELIEHGIIQPRGERQSDWSFNLTMVGIAKRATRLHRDLDLDWSAVALIEELIEERDQLQRENALLKQRLQRFLIED